MNEENSTPNHSVYTIILVNMITIILAIFQKWDFLTIIWIYWGQSIIIGFFTVIKILSMKEFSTEGVQILGAQPTSNLKTKILMAFFFVIHYGIFHLAYLFFIIFSTINFAGTEGSQTLTVESIPIISIVFTLGLFFVNHLISFIVNRKELEEKKSIATVLFYPYARIIPMHFIIVFGGIFFHGMISMIIFMVLKTFADVIMHIQEHNKFRGVVVTTSLTRI